MNEPKNFEEFRKKQLDNERVFDNFEALLKEHDAKLDRHTHMLAALQTDVTSIKTTMATKDDISTLETRLSRIEDAQEQILKLLQVRGE